MREENSRMCRHRCDCECHRPKRFGRAMDSISRVMAKFPCFKCNCQKCPFESCDNIIVRDKVDDHIALCHTVAAVMPVQKRNFDRTLAFRPLAA